MRGAGWIVSGLVALFMAFDAVAKILRVAPVVEASTKLGVPAGAIPVLGIVLLVCTVVYAAPRTAILGRSS